MSENKHEALGLSDEHVLDMYYHMLLARSIDERTLLLNRAGELPFSVSGQGQEAAQVGAAFALNKELDYLCPYYRDIALITVFGMTARDLMLSAYAKEEDPNSGGRQMPGHFGAKKYRILSTSSPVTTQVPHAAGMALASRMQGENAIVFASFGEGSSNQGDFHEGANFAGVHRLPVILFCENNKYAISVPLSKQVACEQISDRAIGYGFPGVTVDGNDPLAVYEVMQTAVKRARDGDGATLIEAMVYRLLPHSSDDDDRAYRSREEVEEAKRNDPLLTFPAYLREVGTMSEEIEQQIRDRVIQEVDEATEYAKQAPYPTPESTLDRVYAEPKGG